ncbi:patatin-like phospholipase family protein [Motilimonas cestriensis]|uniref:patatin-like phospholipase family protein n=1 Tax=Motilimonas cestriensis TaxID=2742685 RepID=UPI003DA2F442
MLRLLFILLLSGSSAVVLASERPKVGLALGGGGAKGAAHVGVLKVLEELNIPVDYIAGTSMGAYVAGMYASGLSAAEIEQRMFATDWNQGFSDKVARENLSYRKKKQNEQFLLQSDIGFDGSGIALPHGVIQGETMARLLRESTLNLTNIDSFDDMPIPYRALAVDLEKMEPYVLKQGNLVNAMQASMSVPGVLRPMEIDGHYLADGGIVNNLPIDVLKEMGADIVIAVDIGSPLVGKVKLDSYLTILDQLSNYMTQSSTRKQIALMSDQDILLKPAISEIGTGEFERMAEILPLGVAAAQAKLGQLQRLSVSADDYALYTARKLNIRAGLPSGDMFIVDRVDIETDAQLSEATIRARLKVKPNQPYDQLRLEKNIQGLYAEGIFERVDYEFVTDQGQRVLKVTAKEKPWGPGYFDMLLGIEETQAENSKIAFGLSYTLTDLTSHGAEWRNRVIMGTQTWLSSEVHVPLNVTQTYYWDAEVVYQQDQRNYFFPDANTSGGTIKYWQTEYSSLGFDTSLGLNISPRSILEAGWSVEEGDMEFIGSSLDSDFTFYGPYILLGYDSLDNAFFPSQGSVLETKLQWITERSDGEKDDGWLGQIDWMNVQSWERHVLELNAIYGGVNTKLETPAVMQDLGGFQNLSGLLRNEISGRYKVFGSVVYRYRILDNNFGAVRLPMYLSASIEQGNVWQSSRDIRFDNMITAGSLGVSVDTGLGPITLATGLAEGGNSSIYFFLGSKI